jgi:hypothetical protein
MNAAASAATDLAPATGRKSASLSLRRLVLFVQGSYYTATGVWPLVSMSTIEAVTGPKTDDWLVQTVGVLAAVIGITVLTGAGREIPSRETLVLAIGSALGFLGVDLVFSLSGIISRIYLADAAAQVVLLAALAISGRTKRGG